MHSQQYSSPACQSAGLSRPLRDGQSPKQKVKLWQCQSPGLSAPAAGRAGLSSHNLQPRVNRQRYPRPLRALLDYASDRCGTVSIASVIRARCGVIAIEAALGPSLVSIASVIRARCGDLAYRDNLQRR